MDIHGLACRLSFTHTHTYMICQAMWEPYTGIIISFSQKDIPFGVSLHRHTILFVLLISFYHSWQVWCPFTHRLRGGKCWHGHLSHEFRASGENLLTRPTVSGRNLNKEVKLNADNFFCASWSCSPALIFHTCSHIFYGFLLMTLANS